MILRNEAYIRGFPRLFYIQLITYDPGYVKACAVFLDDLSSPFNVWYRPDGGQYSGYV